MEKLLLTTTSAEFSVHSVIKKKILYKNTNANTAVAI